MTYTQLFSSTPDHIWLNAASEGPLPTCAKEALEEVVARKSCPHQLTFSYFAEVPIRLKKSIGALINVPYRDVVLADSASYGVHLLANGMRWEKGDEIILMQNDFPTNILPWLALEKQGVVIKQIKPAQHILSVDELSRAMTPKTKLACLSHVHTFSGYMLDDVSVYADVCHKSGAKFVLNVSQSCGNMPLDVGAMDADAVVCAGYKWLLGPYGIGFAWIKPDLRNTLELNRAYWIAQMSEEELKGEDALTHKEITSSRKLDFFGTANFFNNVPFTASIDLILDIGLDNIKAYNDTLTDLFLDNLNHARFDFISPIDREKRSALIVFSLKNPENNANLFKHLTEAGLHTALWKNNIRVTPHIYNTPEHIQKLLTVLGEFTDE